MYPHPMLAVLSLWIVMALAACGTTGTGGGSSSSDPIDREELTGLSVSNAYDVVDRLRPRWLRSRGSISLQDPEAGLPVVYLDGVRYGHLEELRGIDVASVQEIEFIRASTATTRFGTGHAGGVIMVHTRR